MNPSTTDNYRLGFRSGAGWPVLYDGHYSTEEVARKRADELGHNTKIFHVVTVITEVE